MLFYLTTLSLLAELKICRKLKYFKYKDFEVTIAYREVFTGCFSPRNQENHENMYQKAPFPRWILNLTVMQIYLI